jgi:hypothetical protein
MTARTFTITTELSGPERQIEVTVYDKVAHMRAAATRFDRAESTHYAIEPTSYEHALAITQTFSRTVDAPDGTETPHPLSGVIRLARGNLGPEIVAHEVIHMAQHLYGLDLYAGQGGVEHDHWDATNEVFAYLYGGLYATVLDVIRKATDPLATPLRLPQNADGSWPGDPRFEVTVRTVYTPEGAGWKQIVEASDLVDALTKAAAVPFAKWAVDAGHEWSEPEPDE